MVDWYYIFSILPLGVYPCSPDIYNVHKFISFFLMSGIHKKVGPFQCGMRNAEFNKIRMNELMGNVLGREL